MPALNSDFKDYFKILQIDSDADLEVITAAYYALMKKYHPDVSNSKNLDYVKEINEAYEILSDNLKRKNYKNKYNLTTKENQVIIKEVSKEPYFSKRNNLKDIELRLKEKEEELNKKEMSINIKMKFMKEFGSISNNGEVNRRYFDIESLITDFSDLPVKKLGDTIDSINSLKAEKKYVIEKILKGKLSLEKEKLIYEIILKDDIKKFQTIIEGAFKFKNLYFPFFNKILESGIKSFNKKISLMTNDLYFTISSDQRLILVIIDIYKKLFSKEELVELLVMIKNIIEKDKLDKEIRKKVLIKILLIIDELGIKNFFKKFIKSLSSEKDDILKSLLDNYEVAKK